MDNFLNVMFILLVIYSIYACINFYFMDWRVHVRMTRQYDDNPEKVTFDEFLKRFNKFDNWTLDKMFPESIFGSNLDTLESVDDYKNYKIHASMIKIDGTYLMLSRWDYSKFVKWKDLKIHELTLKLLEKRDK